MKYLSTSYNRTSVELKDFSRTSGRMIMSMEMIVNVIMAIICIEVGFLGFKKGWHWMKKKEEEKKDDGQEES